MILSDLLPDTLGRIEEAMPTGNPTGAPNGPIFWSLKGEVYVQMVDALFEAALLTGVVQLTNVAVTLPANTTYFALQNNTGIGIPKGVISCLKMRAPYSIRKTTLKALDEYDPTWQQQDAATQIKAWFPLGTSYFGIYPQFSVESIVTMDFLYSPINELRPYDGNETIPLQTEFADLCSQYAASMLRSKEGGAEAETAETVFMAFMSRMKQLSLFQTRLDSLVYSRAYGGQTRVNPREVV